MWVPAPLARRQRWASRLASKEPTFNIFEGARHIALLIGGIAVALYQLATQSKGGEMGEKRHVIGGNDGWLNVKREPSGQIIALIEYSHVESHIRKMEETSSKLLRVMKLPQINTQEN